MEPKHGVPCRRTWGGGFTLVEMLVATTVMIVTLLGVYAVFRQALAAEGSVSAQWRNRHAANAVASHLAGAIQRLVILPNIPPIRGGKSDAGEGYQLVCTVFGEGRSPRNPARAAIQHRRYRWGLDGEQAGRLLLQTIPMAGTAHLLFSREPQESAERSRWERVKPIVIAEGIDALSITYRPATAPNASWKKRWDQTGKPVMVRIRVRVGEQTVKRIVTPAVSAPIVAKQ